jgi:hypothetical protein
MNSTEAREWAEDFESKGISELESLSPPAGMHTHIIRHWQKARLAAIEARKAALNSARAGLVQQIAARAGQLSAPPVGCAVEVAAVAAEEPVESPDMEQEIEFNSANDAENLRPRIAAAIARNSEPEPVLKPLLAPAVPPRTPPLEAMEIQISSSASFVEGITRQFREQDFSAALTCEVMKSMAVLIAANAALGKVVYHFRDSALDTGASGRRSNAS